MIKFLFFLLPLLALLLFACTDVGYYVQCASGQLDLMRRCRPIDKVIADPKTSPQQRQLLERIRTARSFASQELGLPDNGSYRQFADLGRPYVVWNVVATPEFSLEPRQWCFPVAGCVSYRGYFDETVARREATRLQANGLDVDLYGVQAYSTLSWFDDPVLNTFLDDRSYGGTSLIFHELAHQQIYIPGDSRFNEAFAVSVEKEGMRRWLQSQARQDEWERYLLGEVRGEEFFTLLNKCRDRLLALYSGPLDMAEKRSAKQTIFAELSSDALEMQKRWGGDGISRWLARGINNARLASLATYRDLVPAFDGLLASRNGNLQEFYAAVRIIASLPSEERLARLDTYILPPQSARNIDR